MCTGLRRFYHRPPPQARLASAVELRPQPQSSSRNRPNNLIAGAASDTSRHLHIVEDMFLAARRKSIGDSGAASSAAFSINRDSTLGLLQLRRRLGERPVVDPLHPGGSSAPARRSTIRTASPAYNPAYPGHLEPPRDRDRYRSYTTGFRATHQHAPPSACGNRLLLQATSALPSG